MRYNLITLDLFLCASKYKSLVKAAKEKNSSEVISSVKESLSDIGIFSEHVENTERLRIIDYKNDTLVLVVPEYHPLVSKLTVKIKDFIEFEMVGLEKGSSLQAMIDKQVQKQNLKIKKKLETVSFEGIRGMVEAGLGIAILPIGAIKPYLKSSKLKTINIDENWAERSIKIAIKNDDSIGKAGALLLNHLIS